MRSLTFIWIVFWLYTNFSFSQENEAAGVLLKKANEVLYDDPEQTLKIAEHLLRNPGTQLEKTQTGLLQTKGYLISGNFTQAIASVELALKEAMRTDDKQIQSEAYLLAAEIYEELDLSEISGQYHIEAVKTAGNDALARKKLEAYQLFVADSVLNTAAAAQFIKTLPRPDDIAYSFITRGTPAQITSRQYRKDGQMDAALTYLRQNNPSGAYWKTIGQLDQSAYFFAKKEYRQVIVLLTKAVQSKTIHSTKLLMATYQMLSDCYLALGDNKGFHEFRQKAMVAENDLDAQTTAATNFAFENLQMEKKEHVAEAKLLQKNITWMLGVAAIALFLAWIFIKWLFATRINHTLDIISYLKLIKKSEKPEEKAEIVTKPAKNVSIPKETEALLLSRLEKFEAGTKFLNKDISLAQMATQLDTNTKYLSEVINKYKGKNVNLYINELRIKYIVEKLKTDPRYLNYKVSYLAEECGFSSHSSFSATFKSITDITPNVFIQFLTEDQKQIKPTLANATP